VIPFCAFHDEEVVMSSRVIVSTLCVVLVWGGLAGSAVGQSSRSGPGTSASSLQTWKAGDETTVGGVIREVLEKRPDGAPVGLNFVMTGSQHVLTVSVGRDLDPQFRNLLQVGASVRVTGVVRTFGGQDYLLAREMVVGGQTIELRNSSGFPVRAKANGAMQPKHVENDLQGGGR
jgi:hypothetical protein